jgi:hypothetical protein
MAEIRGIQRNTLFHGMLQNVSSRLHSVAQGSKRFHNSARFSRLPVHAARKAAVILPAVQPR